MPITRALNAEVMVIQR